MKFLLYLFLFLSVTLTTGCECNKDITNDPETKFGAVKDHLFATKKVMLVYGGRNPATGEESYAISVAGETSSGGMPTAITPIGTVLRPICATVEVCESGDITTYVQIESGDFAGKRAKLWNDFLFFPSGPYADGTKKHVGQWEPNPDYLAPASP